MTGSVTTAAGVALSDDNPPPCATKPMAFWLGIREQPTELRSLDDMCITCKEIRHIADRPTLAEMADRLRYRSKTTLKVSPADAVRAERDRL